MILYYLNNNLITIEYNLLCILKIHNLTFILNTFYEIIFGFYGQPIYVGI